MRICMPLSRWLQLALAAMFFGQGFVYTAIDPYLAQAFPSTSGLNLSVLFGAYPVGELVAIALLVLLQALPQISALQPPVCYVLSTAAYAAFTAAGVLAVVWASSVEAMLCQRLLLGLTGGVYTVYVFKGVAGAFQPADALKAIAFINAGLVAGDSAAPIVGAAVFSTAGVQLANATQPAVCTVALLLLLGVPFSIKRHKQHLPSSGRSGQQTDAVSHSSTTSTDSSDSNSNKVGSSSSNYCISIQPLPDKACADAIMTVHVLARDCQQADDCTVEGQSSHTTAGHTRLMWKFLSHKPLTAQMCMLVLTQSMSCLVTILLPQAWAGQPTWFVLAAFAIQASCAIVAPFIVKSAVRLRPNLSTPLVLSIASLMLAVASGVMLPAAAAAATPITVSAYLAITFICGAVTGAASAAIEVLIFHHATIITADMGCQLAVDIGSILYTLFYAACNFLGGVLGGAVAHAHDHTPSYVVAGVSAGVLVCGALLSASMCWSQSAPKPAERQQPEEVDAQ